MVKAQLSFDFYFALVVFVVFISSVFFKLITFFPFYSSEITNQIIRSEAYQISEILINDVGYPGNWYDGDKVSITDIKRLGLSDEIKNKTNILSTSKITAFDTLCKTEGHDKILELLDIKDGFWVLLKRIDPPGVLIECSQEESVTKARADITRIVAFDDGSFGELRLSVWKK